MLRGPYRPKNFELAQKKKKMWSIGLVFGKGRQRKTNAVCSRSVCQELV